MGGKRGTELETEVTTKLSEEGVTADKWKITVTDAGVKIAAKIEAKPGTLGYLITSASDYGKTVDYSVTVDGTTHSDWKVLYKTDEYIFIVTSGAISTTLTTTTTSLTSEQSRLYSIFKLGEIGYTLNFNNNNSKAVAGLVANYSAYANSSVYGNNVVGAIGSPTFELLAAGYNEYTGSKALIPIVDLEYVGPEIADGIHNTNGAYGYFTNNLDRHGVSLPENDGIYGISSTYLLSSPSARDYSYGPNCIPIVGVDMYSDHNDVRDGGSYNNCQGSYSIRPVVCLKSSIPATVGTTTDFSLVK